MIVYWLQREMFTRRGKIVVKRFRGTVTFHDGSKAKAITVGTGASGCRKQVIFRATCFDDSTEPPTLGRCDYNFNDLCDHGAQLPPFYIDQDGRIVRTLDLQVVMGAPAQNA